MSLTAPRCVLRPCGTVLLLLLLLLLLSPTRIKDKAGRRPEDPEYNPRTLRVPGDFYKTHKVRPLPSWLAGCCGCCFVQKPLKPYAAAAAWKFWSCCVSAVWWRANVCVCRLCLLAILLSLDAVTASVQPVTCEAWQHLADTLERCIRYHAAC
jgi:hypothetical protein